MSYRESLLECHAGVSIDKIERAKELLGTVRHAAMATVNEDGSPHNTPYFFMCSPNLVYLYWGSHPQSEHSKNAVRTGQIFVVLYDAAELGGLYIQAAKARVAGGNEFVQALAEHNRRRTLLGKAPLPLQYYQGGDSQRMYIADIQHFWVNDTERRADGLILRDVRREVGRTDLLSPA